MYKWMTDGLVGWGGHVCLDCGRFFFFDVVRVKLFYIALLKKVII